jgi:hypothetical protein
MRQPYSALLPVYLFIYLCTYLSVISVYILLFDLTVVSVTLMQCLLPPCCIVFVFVMYYCYDMYGHFFWPSSESWQVSLTYTAYVVTYVKLVKCIFSWLRHGVPEA